MNLGRSREAPSAKEGLVAFCSPSRTRGWSLQTALTASLDCRLSSTKVGRGALRIRTLLLIIIHLHYTLKGRETPIPAPYRFHINSVDDHFQTLCVTWKEEGYANEGSTKAVI